MPRQTPDPPQRAPRAPRRGRRSRSRSAPAPLAGLEQEELANGLLLTDKAPGAVGRYRQSERGAWLCARVLLYKFGSFPRLWAPGDEDGEPRFAYNWVAWLGRLGAMQKDVGAWRDAAIFLTRLSPPPSTKTVEDIAKAVIELVLRDAEVERAALRPPSAPGASATIPNERAFMTRARTATTYAPRAEQIQRHIFQALEACNVSLLQRIADDAPDGHFVRDMLPGPAF